MAQAKELADKHKVDPFLMQKWERVFNKFFDCNENKSIEWEDFFLVTRHIRDLYGADSEQMGFARNSMKALFDGLLLIGDKNKDQKISLDEWVSLLKHSEGKDLQWFVDYLTFLFKLFDVSSDKKLDIAEYKDGMSAYGFDASDADAAFRKFAVDPKTNKPIATIDFTQFKNLWHEYFYSTNVNALGNSIFGCL